MLVSIIIIKLIINLIS